MYVRLITIRLFLVIDKLKSLSSTSLSLFFIVCVAAIVHMSCSNTTWYQYPSRLESFYSTTTTRNEVDELQVF